MGTPETRVLKPSWRWVRLLLLLLIAIGVLGLGLSRYSYRHRLDGSRRSGPPETSPPQGGLRPGELPETWQRIWQIYERGLLMLATGTSREEVTEFWQAEYHPLYGSELRDEVEQLLHQLRERLSDPTSQAWYRDEDVSTWTPARQREHHWKWLPYGTGKVTTESRFVWGRAYPWEMIPALIDHLGDHRLIPHTAGMRVRNYAAWSLCETTLIPFTQPPEYEVDAELIRQVTDWWQRSGCDGPAAGAIGGLNWGSLEDRLRLLERIEQARDGGDARSAAFDVVSRLREMFDEADSLADHLLLARELEQRADVTVRDILCQMIVTQAQASRQRSEYPLGMGYLVEHGSRDELETLVRLARNELQRGDSEADDWVCYVVRWYLFQRPESVPLMAHVLQRFADDRALATICYRWIGRHLAAPPDLRLAEFDTTDGPNADAEAWEDEQWDDRTRASNWRENGGRLVNATEIQQLLDWLQAEHGKMAPQ